MKYDRFVKQLKARQSAIAKERDKLRDLADEANELKEHCDEAFDDIERAVDALSRLQ